MTDLKNVLVRGRRLDLSHEYGAAVVPEIVRRTITFKINMAGEISDTTLPGIALIGDSTDGSVHNLEPIARFVGKIALTIEQTDEFLWTPVNCHRDPMVELWTIEAVPFAQWFRLIIPTDAAILREAGMQT